MEVVTTCGVEIVNITSAGFAVDLVKNAGLISVVAEGSPLIKGIQTILDTKSTKIRYHNCKFFLNMSRQRMD